ncbi:hypothetical protein EUGRSUZ_L02632 [Eucalyptus grandis]|uniref:Uncharacterized protein n=1 Tax=Eucalyptus grandis TaxID=71139 RepID=A0AAD9T9L7_EUCGR|nr:hypothetical protein EUGRSUZ_L02632 [Eucalyptus grandis]
MIREIFRSKTLAIDCLFQLLCSEFRFDSSHISLYSIGMSIFSRCFRSMFCVYSCDVSMDFTGDEMVDVNVMLMDSLGT